METKICSKCQEKKEICNFRIDRSKKDGRYSSCRECCSKVRLEKQEIYKERSKNWYENNRYEFNKKRWLKTKNDKNKLDLVRKSQKIWELNNRKKRNEYSILKRNGDPIKKISENVRTRIRIFLKKNNITKGNKTFDIVGCTPEFLKEHIEKQFKDGMCWEKMGKEIHIDHIIPLSTAKTEEEIYKLCHYTNLQPLWAQENLSKGNRII